MIHRWLPALIAVLASGWACSETVAPPPPPPLPPPVVGRPPDPGITFAAGCLTSLPVDNPIAPGGTPFSIPSIFDPPFLAAGEADFMSSPDLVLGVEIDSTFFAFPAKILNYHEIVNFTVNGKRYHASWCPLSYSFLVFRNLMWDESKSSKLASFKVSGALMDNNLIMWDVDTQSTWTQVLGISYLGPAEGNCLEIHRNAVATTWDFWKRLHPETVVLTDQAAKYTNPPTDTQISPSDYNTNPYEEYWDGRIAPPHPISNPDDRLDIQRIVLGIHGKHGLAAALVSQTVGHTTVGETPVAIFHDPASGTRFVFENNLDGRTRFFESADPDSAGVPRFRDSQDGTLWTIDGIAVQGPDAGKRLAQMPALDLYWFVWATFFTDSAIIQL